MKRGVLRVVCVRLLVLATMFSAIVPVVFNPSDFSSSSSALDHPAPATASRSTSRSLLSLDSPRSSRHDSALVAALDGTIYLEDTKSGEVLWSFSSGPSLHSSYQAPLNQDSHKPNASGTYSDYYVDCGDDWDLFVYSSHDSSKVRIQVTAEDYVKQMPFISEDGGITLGSKKTNVFVVDAITGRLISSYKLAQNNEADSFLFGKDNGNWAHSGYGNANANQMPLYITRSDYFLQSFAPNSSQILWNLTIAEIGAAFLCKDVGDKLGGADMQMGHELILGGKRYNMPLPCQSKAIVFPNRGSDMLESSYKHNSLPKSHHKNMALPAPGQTTLISSKQKTVPNALDSLPAHGRAHDSRHRSLSPSLPGSGSWLSSEADADKLIDLHTDGNVKVVPSLPSGSLHDADMPHTDGLEMIYKNPRVHWRFLELCTAWKTFWNVSPVFYLVFLTLMAVAFVIYFSLVPKQQLKLNKKPVYLNPLSVSSKKKKGRRSGNFNNCSKMEEGGNLAENGDRVEPIRTYQKKWLNHSKFVGCSSDGRRIGKLIVSNTEIAKGSNGTVVFEGFYEGRPVAVKRLVQLHHDVAFKEIQNLIASDRHPNIVRWYGVEYDQDFVYLSLERCDCSLNDLIQICSNSSHNLLLAENQITRAMNEYKDRLDTVKGMMQNMELWRANGCPSPLLLKLMRDVVSGLEHLHDLGIIHRDLKPQNVLIIKEKALCAKLSDMGISKRLLGDSSSLGHHATGCGSSGWQAPEQLLHGRQTRAVDLFSLGCLLFYCMTGGRHPFGDHFERDINIVNNQVDLFLIEHIPEAVDLCSHLLDPIPESRLKASEVLYHPLFWSSELRLSFLRDTSDRVELEDRETGSDLLKALERIAPLAFGVKWDEKMESSFINNIGHYRHYKFDSVRDLLRVMRNKLNHYRELPKEIQVYFERF
ncbi:KEN domain, partial [Dillenia turbinata]